MNCLHCLSLYCFIQNFTIIVIIQLASSTNLQQKAEEDKKLNSKERNFRCCMKKMKCCHEPLTPPGIEMRAILTHCPFGASATNQRRAKQPMSHLRENDIKNFRGFDKDEPLEQSEITKCHKKLVLTMKIANKGRINCKNEYIVIDHIYDSVTEKTARLLNPYVIKIRQQPITQMYKMKLVHVVNSEAREEVYNKEDSNYTGCFTSTSKPTCGAIKYNGQIIPYSEGFCCSCDALKNAMRQPENLKESSDPVITYSDPAYLLDGVECPKNLHPNILELVPEKEELPKKMDLEDLSAASNSTPSSAKVLASAASNKIAPAFSENKEDMLQFQKSNNATSCNTSDKNHTTSSQLEKIIREILMKNRRRQIKEQNLVTLEKLLSSNRANRQVQSSGSQRRGGQNCVDRYTPPKLDPIAYQESTHCLRFSELWYAAYELSDPLIEHSMHIQIFEKHEDINGQTRWRDLSEGKMDHVGTFKPFYKDPQCTLAITYKPVILTPCPEDFSLDCKTTYVLIPEGVKHSKANKYPEQSGGPGEFLVVSRHQISLEGDRCNMAGVGFEAFAKQPNRCTVPKGSCLANQPKNLWEHDHEAERLGKKGCFFLKHYGHVPKNPIRKISSDTKEQYLTLEYTGAYLASVELEVKADFNTILRAFSPAKITEVYIDSTRPNKTILTVKVTNAGLVSSSFKTRLSDCPLKLPATFNNIESQFALIPPQHQHIFTLEIICRLPSERFHCSVEVLNSKNELIALRRIRIQKLDRCICTWHCLCACLGSVDGLKCIPMSLEHYHAAGFQGSLPVPIYIVHYTFVDEVFAMMLYIFLFLCLTLLLLGITKALIGLCCCSAIGVWGLDVLLDLPKRMDRYHESELFDMEVEYDDEGWPVDPCTKKKVRNVGCATEFCVNVVFFFTYPIAILFLLLKRICCPYYEQEEQRESDDVCTCDSYEDSSNTRRRQSQQAGGARETTSYETSSRNISYDDSSSIQKGHPSRGGKLEAKEDSFSSFMEAASSIDKKR